MTETYGYPLPGFAPLFPAARLGGEAHIAVAPTLDRGGPRQWTGDVEVLFSFGALGADVARRHPTWPWERNGPNLPAKGRAHFR